MRQRIPVPDGVLDLEVAVVESAPDPSAICVAHPFGSMHDVVPLVARLTGRTVVSVNPLGVPPSSEPTGPPSFERIVEDLEQTRKALGLGPWVMWGMSGGGMIGQVYARTASEGLAGLILDSVAVSFRATVRHPDCVLNPSHPASVELDLDPAADGATPVRWEEHPDGAWVWVDPSGDAVIVAPEEPTASQRRAMPLIWEHDAAGWLGAISVPTLVIAGASDPVAPVSLVGQMAEAIPGAEFLSVTGAGHVPVTTHAASVGPAVTSFLERCARSRRPFD